MTLTEHLSPLPPFICRLLAKKKGQGGYEPLTNQDIAERSGISLRTVVRIGQKSGWANVKIELADKYLEACGIDPLRLKKPLSQLRRILNSKNGLEGTWHLHKSKRLSPWMKTKRTRHLKKLAQLLEE